MMDLVLQAWVSGLIEAARVKHVMGAGRPWRAGEKLKLLFAGYNGTRNTGADVRVEEMLRQVRHVLGADRTEFAVMTQNFERTAGYFEGTKQVRLTDIFPPFLASEVPQHDGVIACEGSMFKSKFANALTTMMIGSLGIAAAQNKISVGYGGEAGKMDPLIASMVARYCKDSFIITRNEESRDVLRPLGVPTELGTDTAWTFEPHPAEFGQKVLSEHGWDGKQPVLVVCPINPFWWPVKAALGKFALRAAMGAFAESHYRSVYFHNAGPEVDAAYDRYCSGIANAVREFRERRNIFVVLVAMERLDAKACAKVGEKLNAQGKPAPVFTSDDYNMYELVSILRACSMMVSSRYHGVVTSMPGLVRSAGITMDERIRNLMTERGQKDLLLTVDEPDLEPKLAVILEKLYTEGDAIVDGIGRNVVKNLKVMARMGVFLEEHVQQRYPEFKIRQGAQEWTEYLHPLSAGLQQLVAKYA